MTSLHGITIGEDTEFKGRLARAGFSAEIIREINRSDDMAKTMYEALMQHPRFALVHGVFNKTENVLAAFKARCAAKGIDFTKFSWVTPEHAPDFTDDEEVAVVLDATLGTLKDTFEFAWRWTVDGQEDEWRYEGMVSDANKLRLLSDKRPDEAEGDSSDFEPWTLAWRRIKLKANVGKKPCDIRDDKTSPGCAMLFVAAQHPERIKATDYVKRFGFWLPGLKCTAPDGDRWRSVPDVYFDRGARRVGLHSYWSDRSDDDLAVPVLWE